MARVCVFDVNETLLDMGALDPHFERVFGDASARPAWFDRFLQLWLTEMVTGSYQPFGTIAGLALDMLAGEGGRASGRGSAKNHRRHRRAAAPPRGRGGLTRPEGRRFPARHPDQLYSGGVRHPDRELRARRVVRAEPLRRYRRAFEAGPRAVPHGGGVSRRGDRRNSARRGPRLGHRGGHEGRLCRRLRGPSRQVALPDRSAPGRRGRRHA